MFEPFGKPIKGLIYLSVSTGLSCMMAIIMPLASRESALGCRFGRRSAGGDSGYGVTDCFGQLGEVRVSAFLKHDRLQRVVLLFAEVSVRPLETFDRG
jgi:hypothetical protein